MLGVVFVLLLVVALGLVAIGGMSVRRKALVRREREADWITFQLMAAMSGFLVEKSASSPHWYLFDYRTDGEFEEGPLRKGEYVLTEQYEFFLYQAHLEQQAFNEVEYLWPVDQEVVLVHSPRLDPTCVCGTCKRGYCSCVDPFGIPYTYCAVT
ncbi:MAG: hypothetical protein GTO63_25700, partial [Anaerolineae bacterium]|nr:hypothetical protein [Anaerolineae bacterium]NIN98130.1 hypothetical protein [Anaerolineae bacterium]NIQ81059.1 hypothetical protein [Anaerolineae bacterium]